MPLQLSGRDSRLGGNGARVADGDRTNSAGAAASQSALSAALSASLRDELVREIEALNANDEAALIVLVEAINGGGRTGNLPSHKGFAARRPFMIKEYAVGRMHPIRLAVISCDPEAIEFGDAIGRGRIERGDLALWDLAN
jgi:hypothetical protein